MSKSFMEQVLDGEADVEDVDEFVEQWHETAAQKDDIGMSFQLYDYLGMTADEYKRWLEEPIHTDKAPNDVLQEIVNERKQEDT